MAEKKEEKPEASNAKDNADKDNFGIIEILKAFLPLVGIFGAFCYLLGRSYIESYYSSLGMTTDALTFSPNDYMFFSKPVVILCLVISFLFFLYWELSESGRGLFSHGFIKDKKFIYRNWEIEYFGTAMLTMFILLIGSLIYLILSFVIEGIKNPWAIIVCSFLILFSFLILCADLMHSRRESKGEKPLKVPPGIRVILAIFIGIIVFLLTMAPIDVLAESQAKSDEMTFPDVRVITLGSLPVHIKTGTPECTNYLDGKLITTNNGITYILRCFLKEKNYNCKDVVIHTAVATEYITIEEVKTIVDDRKTCCLIYAIPVDSIQNIIYYSER